MQELPQTQLDKYHEPFRSAWPDWKPDKFSWSLWRCKPKYRGPRKTHCQSRWFREERAVMVRGFAKLSTPSFSTPYNSLLCISQITPSWLGAALAVFFHHIRKPLSIVLNAKYINVLLNTWICRFRFCTLLGWITNVVMVVQVCHVSNSNRPVNTSSRHHFLHSQGTLT